ncbi:hypothetical protein CRENBAI_024998 [Crenichthys baileyi]|uniref:Uncharacterized protein n=1 Tax=Crenichthys baileyi TaxID=28760 RepID=A0AAV9RPQ1_9TELE
MSNDAPANIRRHAGDAVAWGRSKQNRLEELYSTSRPRGVQVQRVELKDLKLLSSRQRCKALEAEAVRAARAKMMVAEGVVKTSHTLKEGDFRTVFCASWSAPSPYSFST